MDEREGDLPAYCAAGRDGRALGVNPRKLPGLRPSPQQRWKLPVGEFIEERYRKRFGGDPRGHDPRGPEASSSKPLNADRDADVSERVRNPAWQLRDLVCYLMNLADDLPQWLEQGTAARDVLPQVSEELREIAKALEVSAAHAGWLGGGVPVCRRRAERRARLGSQDDCVKPLDFPLLTDENIAADVVAGIRARGCDVRSADEERLIGVRTVKSWNGQPPCIASS